MITSLTIGGINMAMFNVTVLLEMEDGSFKVGKSDISTNYPSSDIIKAVLNEFNIKTPVSEYMLTISSKDANKYMHDIKFEEDCILQIIKVPKKLILKNWQDIVTND